MTHIAMHNYATNELVVVDSENLTDDLARQLIPQDETTQWIYDDERRRHSHITLAMSLALLSRYDLRAQ